MLRVDMERETALDMLLRNSICAMALDMLAYASERRILRGEMKPLCDLIRASSDEIVRRTMKSRSEASG